MHTYAQACVWAHTHTHLTAPTAPIYTTYTHSYMHIPICTHRLTWTYVTHHTHILPTHPIWKKSLVNITKPRLCPWTRILIPVASEMNTQRISEDRQVEMEAGTSVGNYMSIPAPKKLEAAWRAIPTFWVTALPSGPWPLPQGCGNKALFLKATSLCVLWPQAWETGRGMQHYMEAEGDRSCSPVPMVLLCPEVFLWVI